MFSIVASGAAFAACSSPEDPASSEPAGGSHGSVVECAQTTTCGTGCTTTSCSTTTTTCSGTTSTTPAATITTTLTCSAPVSGGACAPGDMIACFDGTSDALVAPCAAGTSTCVADTSGYDAACVGEVIPHPDACDFASAWSCDASPPACGPGLFAQTFAGTGNESATSIALDAAGNVVVAGDATAGDLDLGAAGTVHLTAAGGFVVKLDAERQPLWGVGLRGATTTVAALDPAGAVYAAGTFDGSLRIDATHHLEAGAGRSVFALKLSPGGSVAWLSRLDQAGSAVVDAIAVAPSGNPVLAGSYVGHATRVGLVNLPSSTDTSGLVAMLDPGSGAARWVRSVRVTGDLSLRAIAADDWGDIFIGGAMLDPGGCSEHAFVGRLTTDGDIGWLRERSFDGVVRALAVAPDQGVVATGAVRATLEIAGVTTRANGFVTHLAPTGAPEWTRALPDWEGHAVGVDDAGSIVVAGAALASAGQPQRGRVQRSDDEGRRFYDLAFVPAPLQVGSAAALGVEALAIAPGVGVFLSGGLRGSAAFGGGAAPPSASSTTRGDAWFAALGP